MENPSKQRKQRLLKATSSSSIKRIALNYAQSTRHHKFTEVSKSFIDEAEAYMIAWIKDKVNRQPSKGKTIR